MEMTEQEYKETIQYVNNEMFIYEFTDVLIVNL